MLLETRGITKSFGVVHALRGVSFTLQAGEVHGLMGENGAGKSTLIKVLTGLNQPDSGEILVEGRPVTFSSPRAAQAEGVAAVYQEINLIPERSVAANLFLGREPRRFGVLVHTARMIAEADALLRRYRLEIDPRRTLRTLGLGLQQLVSIARVVSLGARAVILDEPTSALSSAEVELLAGVVKQLRRDGIGLVSLGARAVILDEPTSALSSAEVELLAGVVEQLRRDGIGIIYVSHRLSECYRLCDRLTVLRDGAVVESAATADLPRPRLIAAMLGRDPGPAPVRAERAACVAGSAPPATALSVRDLSWRRRVRNVSLDVGRGEILGLVGLLGSGRTETFKAIYGAEKPDAGTVEIAGRRIQSPRPSESIRRGLAFLSEDRRSEGIFGQLSVRENLTASVLPRISRWGIISRRRQDEIVGRYLRELGVRSAGPDSPITALSGGNQQKVLIARALCAEPGTVMLDDPTRGIDVGAKAEVHRVVRGLAAEGLGVLVTSSEIEEVVELADRLVVLDEGAVTADIASDGVDSDHVLALLAGGPAAA